MTQLTSPARRPFDAIALRLLAVLLFVVLGGIVKGVSARVPLGEIVFFRCAVAWLVLAGAAIVRGTTATDFDLSRFPAHLLRALIGCVSLSMTFYAFSALPLVEAEAVAFLAPLWLIAAAPLFGERPSVVVAVAAIVGFLGVCFVTGATFLGSAGSGSSTGYLVGISGAALAAISVLLTRRLTFRSSTNAIALNFAGISALLASTSMIFGWLMPSATDILLLIVCGCLGALGHIVNTAALRRAEASLLAPLDYAGIALAAVAGFVIFGEVADAQKLIGVALTIGAGLLIFVTQIRKQAELSRV